MNNFNTRLLQIQDMNIRIKEEIQEIITNGRKILQVEGKLTYKAKKCPCCKKENENYSIVKDGYRTTTIKLLKCSELPVKLKLKKQRYKCKNCQKKFTAETTLVKKYCQISNPVKQAVILKLSEILPNKYIAKEYNISETTVARICRTTSNLLEVNNYKNLPKHMCFDEIKSTKEAENKMSFVYEDAEKGKLIDILDGRTHRKLKNYFIRFPRKIRKKVKTITIDIYSPYMKLIKEMFPNAEIIIDRFHIVQNINREFNKYRVEVMKKYLKIDSTVSTKLKNYWKILLKNGNKIDYGKIHKSRNFNRYITHREVLDFLLSKDEILNNDYKIMQDIRTGIENRDITAFKESIHREGNYSQGVKKAIKTIRKYEEYMLNSIRYEYSNGLIEGINNKIKLIKRVSFGYSSFINFRLRILIVFKLFDKDFDYEKNITQQKFAA